MAEIKPDKKKGLPLEASYKLGAYTFHFTTNQPDLNKVFCYWLRVEELPWPIQDIVLESPTLQGEVYRFSRTTKKAGRQTWLEAASGEYTTVHLYDRKAYGDEPFASAIIDFTQIDDGVIEPFPDSLESVIEGRTEWEICEALFPVFWNRDFSTTFVHLFTGETAKVRVDLNDAYYPKEDRSANEVVLEPQLLRVLEYR